MCLDINRAILRRFAAENDSEWPFIGGAQGRELVSSWPTVTDYDAAQFRESIRLFEEFAAFSETYTYLYLLDRSSQR